MNLFHLMGISVLLPLLAEATHCMQLEVSGRRPARLAWRHWVRRGEGGRHTAGKSVVPCGRRRREIRISKGKADRLVWSVDATEEGRKEWMVARETWCHIFRGCGLWRAAPFDGVALIHVALGHFVELAWSGWKVEAELRRTSECRLEAINDFVGMP